MNVASYSVDNGGGGRRNWQPANSLVAGDKKKSSSSEDVRGSASSECDGRGGSYMSPTYLQKGLAVQGGRGLLNTNALLVVLLQSQGVDGEERHMGLERGREREREREREEKMQSLASGGLWRTPSLDGEDSDTALMTSFRYLETPLAYVRAESTPPSLRCRMMSTSSALHTGR
ncbi:hypothetical protein JZ751_013828 [Albula glossodonta]|uniref:Uncharacterized protein n=1 Tax=Albula glossodonta TaxID=121402 RepID=A0A8T2P4S3_9TELE|nr:hypothetical protein JZ751_013828 [Albula glossodonta]